MLLRSKAFEALHINYSTLLLIVNRAIRVMEPL